MEFHNSLVNELGSPRLTRLYASLSGETHLTMAQVKANGLIVSQHIIDEHQAIINAIEAGDADLAVTEESNQSPRTRPQAPHELSAHPARNARDVGSFRWGGSVRGWTVRIRAWRWWCGRSRRRPATMGGRLGWGRLTLADRKEITVGLHTRDSSTAIAALLGEAVSRYRGRWPPTAADMGTGPGGRISVPASRPGIPRRRSSPARCWLPRSVPGCTSGHYRSGSYGGCAASWPAACAPAGLGAARAAVIAGRIYQGHGDDRRSSCRGPARRSVTSHHLGPGHTCCRAA